MPGDGLANRAWRAARGAAAAVGINFRHTQKPAIRLSTVLTAVVQQFRAGVRIGVSPATLIGAVQKPALRLVASITGVAVLPVLKPALRVTSLASGTPTKALSKPAINILQIKYDLTHRSGAAAATNIGTFAWTTPANAQGLHDAAAATMAGDVAAARDGAVRLDYADFVNKTELVISSVLLHFYVQSSGTVANNGDLRLAYRADGTFTYGGTVLETITGNVNNFSAPRTFDITAAIGGSWSKLNDLTAFVRGLTDVGENLIAYSANAVELEVVASKTDSI